MAASTIPTVTVYKNGDSHFPGKKIVVSPKYIRNFDTFLDRVTRDIRAGVAVRSIRTPSHGTRVANLNKLENGGAYVAVGTERFKALQYNEIQDLHQSFRSKTAPQPAVKPVFHSRIHASARYSKVAESDPLKNRSIHVYRNGDGNHPSVRILLDKRVLQSMDLVLQYITNKINLMTGAVRTLYSLDGHEISDVKHIESGEKYVAVGYGKGFVKMDYSAESSSITPRRATGANTFSGSNKSSVKSKGPRKPRIKPKNSTLENSSDSNPPPRKWKQRMAEKKAKVEQQDTESSGADSSQALSQDLSPVQKLALSPELTKSPTLFDKIYDKVESETNEVLAPVEEQYQDLKSDTVDKTEIVQDNIDSVEDRLDDTLPDDDPEDKASSGPTSPSKQRLSHNSPEKIFDKALSKKHKAKSPEKSEKQEPESKPEAPERSGTFSSETKPADEGNVKWRSERKGTISRSSRASKKSEVSNKEKKESKPKREASVDNGDSPKQNSRKNSKSSNKSVDIEESPKKSSRKNSNSSNKSVEMPEDVNAEISTPVDRPASKQNSRRDSNENDSIQAEAEKLNEEIISQSEENMRSKLEQESNDVNEEDDLPRKSASPSIFKASGENSEKADVVKDTGETRTEQTIDMLPAEEVEEEIQEDGNR